MDAFSQTIIRAVNQVKNAVVKIDVYKTSSGKLRPAGSGSGFIFSSDGLIFTNSHVVHGASKIMVSLLNTKIQRHHHLLNQKGLFVTSVEPNSPASRSQVKEGDIIVSFNHKPINTLHEFFKELSKRDILTMVDIAVVRHTELLNFGIFPSERKSIA